MKLVAVAVLVVGMLCNSMLAMAESPVPFSALMQSAGAEPSVPPIRDANDQSASASTQSAPRRHMTAGGKVMTGVGIGLAVIGGVILIGTAAWPKNKIGSPSSSDQAKLYGAGGGIMAGGAILIVLGMHHRSAQ